MKGLDCPRKRIGRPLRSGTETGRGVRLPHIVCVFVSEWVDTARALFQPWPREFAGRFYTGGHSMKWPDCSRKRIGRPHRSGTETGPAVRLPITICVCEWVSRHCARPVGDEAICCGTVERMLGASRTRSGVVWLHHGMELGFAPQLPHWLERVSAWEIVRTAGAFSLCPVGDEASCCGTVEPMLGV